MKRKRFLLIVSALFFALLVACTSDVNEENNLSEGNNDDPIEGNDAENDPIEEPEEITLRFWNPGDHDFIEEHLKEKFPHISYEWHDIQVVNSYKDTIEEQFTNDLIPDIMVLQDYSMALLDDYDMLFDLSSLIEKHQFDLDRWPEFKISAVYSHQPDDEGLYALPGELSYHGLAYNKDVFDKFGVDYPEDDMTWDDVISLAREVTGEREGVQYRGLDIAEDAQMVGMLDDWLVTADDVVHFEGREDVKELFELIDTIASIPGNIADNDGTDFYDPWSYGIFTEENVAMTVHARFIADQMANAVEEKTINFDFVSWPIWDEDHPTQPYRGGNFYSISPYTEYPDEAFQVIDYLTSDEWLEISDPIDYGHDILKDKNMEAFYRHPLNVPDSRSSRHQVDARWRFGVHTNQMIYEGVDVNTAIREAQETTEAMIEEAKGSE